MSRSLTLLTVAGLLLCVGAEAASAQSGWEGRRRISFQRKNDLFYNSYVGPQPSGTAAEMYVSPLPAPAYVGHTYNTYQPLLPHEYLHTHKRSYWTHNPGHGWTRTSVRYNSYDYALKAFAYQQVKPHYYPKPAHRQ